MAIKIGATVYGETNDEDTVLSSANLTTDVPVVGTGNKGVKSLTIPAAPGNSGILVMKDGKLEYLTAGVANKYLGTNNSSELNWYNMLRLQEIKGLNGISEVLTSGSVIEGGSFDIEVVPITGWTGTVAINVTGGAATSIATNKWTISNVTTNLVITFSGLSAPAAFFADGMSVNNSADNRIGSAQLLGASAGGSYPEPTLRYRTMAGSYESMVGVRNILSNGNVPNNGSMGVGECYVKFNSFTTTKPMNLGLRASTGIEVIQFVGTGTISDGWTWPSLSMDKVELRRASDNSVIAYSSQNEYNGSYVITMNGENRYDNLPAGEYYVTIGAEDFMGYQFGISYYLTIGTAQYPGSITMRVYYNFIAREI